MAQCNWDPQKHGGRPCPVHGGGGLWDENVFTRADKLKKAGYTKEDLADADEEFDGDYDEEFKPTSDDFLEELSDNDYVYGGLKNEQDIYNMMAERLSKKYETEITPEEVEKGLKDGGFSMDEYNKSLEDDGDGEDDLKDDSEMIKKINSFTELKDLKAFGEENLDVFLANDDLRKAYLEKSTKLINEHNKNVYNKK